MHSISLDHCEPGMQLLDSSSSSVFSVWTGEDSPAAATGVVFVTLKLEYACSAARDMNVTVGSMCRSTRGPDAFSPSPPPVPGELGVCTKLARVEGAAGGTMGEE